MNVLSVVLQNFASRCCTSRKVFILQF